MINEKVFINLPLNFEKGVKIYPPTVKEVIQQNYFPVFRKLLMSSQEDIEDDIEERKNKEKDLKVEKIPTPLEFLLGAVAQDKRIELLVKEGFKFFIHEDVTFLIKQKIIIIGNLEEEKLKTGKHIDELPVYSPNCVNDLQSNTVYLIANEKYSNNIRLQLNDLGVTDVFIFEFK